MMLQKKQKGDQECVRETGGTVNCASFPKVAKEGFNDERHPHACTSDQFSFIEHLLQTGPYFSHRMSKMVREMKKTWSLPSECTDLQLRIITAHIPQNSFFSLFTPSFGTSLLTLSQLPLIA